MSRYKEWVGVDATVRNGMRSNKSKDTTPELAVRKTLWSLGYRYRLHRKDLPGTPDIVFARRRKVIFVHGCFWHQHAGCRRANVPKSRLDYWLPKLARNVARDGANRNSLAQLGWSVLVVWECELRDASILAARLRDFLGPPRMPLIVDRLAGAGG